jgi:hypothetical protein
MITNRWQWRSTALPSEPSSAPNTYSACSGCSKSISDSELDRTSIATGTTSRENASKKASDWRSSTSM